MQQNKVVVGIFEQPIQARNTLDELRRAGYRDDEIGLLAHTDKRETEDDRVVNVTSSAVGGLLGGLVGATSGTLLPGVDQDIFGGILLSALGVAIVGAFVGNIIGLLNFDKDVAEQEIHYYQREREKGHSIILVKSPTEFEHIAAIMTRNCALKCQYWSG